PGESEKTAATLRVKSEERRTNEKGRKGKIVFEKSELCCVRVSSLPPASRSSMCHGFSVRVTEPKALVQRCPPATASCFQEPSCGTAWASISDSESGREAPVVVVRRRRRTVRGETKSMDRGSSGSVAYSPDGNTAPGKGRKPGFMLSKARRGAIWLRFQTSAPWPVAG